MRLTLRTMLAYLDDILEPADHQDVGQKIEESEFATNLVHRVRDVTQRLRLGAPKLAGRGMGLDPNTVAEYLDNTLASERVADFEKVCLESDVHLAEVASCHQILTLVLGEPAEVDAQMRRRMYGVLSESGPATASAPAGQAAAGAAGASPPVLVRADSSAVRERPEVPEYLRKESRRSNFWSIAGILLVAACLLIVVVLAAGKPDATNPVLRPVLSLFGLVNAGAPETAQKSPEGPKAPAASPTGSEKANETKLAADTGPKGADTVPKGDAAPKEVAAPEPKLPGDPTKAGPVEDGVGQHATEPTVAPKPPAVVVNDKGGKPADAAHDLAPPLPPQVVDDKRAPVPPVPVPDAGAQAAPAGAGIGPIEPAKLPGELPAAEGAGQRLGRLISDQEVLLRKAGSGGEWQRVVPTATLNVGDKLLVLPTFRPTVTLSSGVTLQLLGETLVKLDGIDADEVPAVRLIYGRMVLMTTGKANVRVKLILGDHSGTVTFNDADATIAAEVRQYHLPGANPETNPARVAATLYGTSGQVGWVGSDGAAEILKSPARLILSPHQGDAAAGDRELPKWIGTEPISPIDARASQILNQSLDEKRPVTQSLLELADHRRAENRSLAARSLALIDEFEPFVNLLNDPDQRAVWPIQIECLQAALARGPESAAKVRAAFEKQRGKEGADLYRMLWGYSREDLQAGAAAKLVDYLDYDNLDYRVLAFTDLRAITGATFNYRPESTAASRQTAVRRWKDQLREGLIAPKGPVSRGPGAADALPGKAPPPPAAKD